MNMKFTLLLATVMVLCAFSIEKAKAQVITPEEFRDREKEADNNRGEEPYLGHGLLVSK